MNADEKKLAVSLIKAVENLLTERNALERLVDMHRIPPHVRKAAVAALLSDRTIGGISHLRFQPIYDQIENAPDVSTVVQSLLAVLQQSSKG